MVDDAKLQALTGKVIGDFAGAVSALLVRVGEQNGLFKAVAAGPGTSADIAKRAGCAERYVREWLSGMAAATYITYDPATQRFSLTPEQAAVFAAEGEPTYLPGFIDCLVSLSHDEPKITAAFKTGEGIGWSEHHHCLFSGTERFFRPGYVAFLLNQWLPALDGVTDKLKAGGKVADIGCGHGASTILMAQAFLESDFTGFDFHAPSVETARARAAAAGVTNVRFEVARAQAFPGTGYDLVTVFDALHDMGDPAGAARHVKGALKPDGTWMVVEPMADDKLEDNLHVLGQLFYGASTMVCTPASLSQEVGLALGAQAGEARLSQIIKQGGFTRVRRAAETPTNMVLEARP
jgi:ubiquinone/menaquinone biosynthesis C-methylase UbiE